MEAVSQEAVAPVEVDSPEVDALAEAAEVRIADEKLDVQSKK